MRSTLPLYVLVFFFFFFVACCHAQLPAASTSAANATTLHMPLITLPLRTPESSFDQVVQSGLFPYEPKFFNVTHNMPSQAEVVSLRLAYYHEGPASASNVVVLFHGNPDWCLLYHTTIPVLLAGGDTQVYCLDLPGFGRSDKVATRAEATHEAVIGWAVEWFSAVVLQQQQQQQQQQPSLPSLPPSPSSPSSSSSSSSRRHITVLGQDWGTDVAFRMVAANPTAVDGLILINGCTGGFPFSAVTKNCPAPPNTTWAAAIAKQMAAGAAWVSGGPANPLKVADAAAVMNSPTCTVRNLTSLEMGGFRAPFPSQIYYATIRAAPLWPVLTPGSPAYKASAGAWAVMENWTKPTLTAFAHENFDTASAFVYRCRIPGAQGQDHRLWAPTVAQHMAPLDVGPEIADMVAEFIARNY